MSGQQDVFTVCDRVMVPRSGRYVVERQIRDATMDEVVKYIVGAEVGEPTEDLGEAGATSKQFP